MRASPDLRSGHVRSEVSGGLGVSFAECLGLEKDRSSCRSCGLEFEVTVEQGWPPGRWRPGMQPCKKKTKIHRRGVAMRFMMMVKHSENQGPPPKGFMDVMAKLGEEAVKAGTMVVSGGLASTAARTRVRLSNGQVRAIDGPFTEGKESIGGGWGLCVKRAKKKHPRGHCFPVTSNE